MAEVLAIVFGLVALVAFGRRKPSSIVRPSELPFRPDATDEEIAGDGDETPVDDADGRDDSSLPPDVGPDWPYPTVDLGDVQNTPRPGYWYRVRSGDTLLGIADKLRAQADAPSSSSRADLARQIVAFNWQKASPPASAFELSVFPDGLIRLLPRYKRNPATVMETDESGTALPLLYMPQAGENPPPRGS